MDKFYETGKMGTYLKLRNSAGAGKLEINCDQGTGNRALTFFLVFEYEFSTSKVFRNAIQSNYFWLFGRKQIVTFSLYRIK